MFSRNPVWRGITFDSVLEMDWTASLTAWGVDWEYHPGTLPLSNGEYWEPDLYLKNAGPWAEDIILEIKGPHNDRIHKPILAQQDYPYFTILIGREPWMRADELGNFAGAVWHLPNDEPYDWDLNGKGFLFVSAEKASEQTPGLKMYRAVEGSRKMI